MSFQRHRIWTHDSMAPEHHGSMASEHHGSMASEHHGSMASEHHGSMAPEHHGSMASEYRRVLLSDFWASLKNFNNESKKSNLQKIRGISFEEARGLLGKNLNVQPHDSYDAVKKDEPLSVIQTGTSKEEQKPVSMADLLHQSLLMGSLVPMEQLYRSQQRLAHVGIPPPVHTFPYIARTDEHKPPATQTPTFRKRIRSATFQKLLLSCINPDRLIFKETPLSFFAIDAGKQFLDLADLQWRYFKGLTHWKRTPRRFPFMSIKFNSEERFVESQDMPGVIFPPLVHKTFMTYPQIDYHKEGHYSLKWDV